MEAKVLETSTTSTELASATEMQNIMKKYGDSKIVSQISKLILNLKKECDQSLLDKSKTSPLTPEEERFLATPIKRQKITDISCNKEITDISCNKEITDISCNKEIVTTPTMTPSPCPVTPPRGQFTYPEFSDVSKLVSDLDNLKLF